MKNYLKIFICCLLAALMLCGCTPAPTPDSPETDTTTPAESTTPAPEPKLDVTLFSAGPSYTVIRPEECEKAIIDITSNLRTKLDELTDHRVSIDTDWLKRGSEPDPEKLEILVGNTNRPETTQVLSSIGYGDFAIQLVGKKLVVAAHTTELLQQAADYLAANLVEVKEDGTVSLTGNYVYSSGIADLISSPQQLAEYTVIFPLSDTTAKDYAQLISQAAQEQFGVTLNYTSDRATPVEKEILIGSTNRPESAALGEMTGLDYKLYASGGKIVLGGKTAVSNSLAAEAFVDKFLSGKYYSSVKIPAVLDLSQSGTITLKDAYDPTLTEGADLRIMSFNILAELWDEKAKATMPGRDKHTVALILSYMPDVVGLQETTALWYSLLEPQLDGIYKFASYTVPNGKTNYSTLMYNIHTTELLECKTTLYTVRNSDNMRHLTWARFRRKSDGAEYIVSCTHWDITHEKRLVQWEENANLINELYAKYKLPIFATGDYNSNEQDLFAKFIEKTGMVDPKYVAKTIVNPGKTTHGLGSKAPDSDVCIDHIAVTPGQDILFYNRLTCPTATDASDHCPIYIDVKLK